MKLKLPFVPGVEVAGIVSAVGKGCTKSVCWVLAVYSWMSVRGVSAINWAAGPAVCKTSSALTSKLISILCIIPQQRSDTTATR